MRGIHNEGLKIQAIRLRQKGFSYPMIIKRLGVPKATLNGWLTGLKLNQSAATLLLRRKQNNFKVVRKKALIALRSSRARNQDEMWKKIIAELGDFRFNPSTKEFLLAMLYLGEGFKRQSVVGLGNSNPRIAAMFVKLLRDVYNVPTDILRGYLHLRMDQNSELEKRFWSKKLQIPVENFRKSQFDKRTAGSKTWPKYHGVCSILCYSAMIEKRLTAIQILLIDKILGS